MENQSIMSVAQRYGLIAGAILVAWSLLTSLLGWNDPASSNAMFKWLGFLVQVGVMAYAIFGAIKYVKLQMNDGHISFGTAFKVGMLTALILGVLMALYTYVYFQFIDPDFSARLLEITQEQMEDKGMEGEELEMAMRMTKKMMSTGMMAIWTLAMTVFFGLILSLIGGAVLKDDAPDPEA